MPLVCMQRSAHMKFQAVKLFIVLCELVQELGKRCLLHLNSFFPFSLLSALDKQNELHFVSFIPASEWLTFLYGKKKILEQITHGVRDTMKQQKLAIVFRFHFCYSQSH